MGNFVIKKEVANYSDDTKKVLIAIKILGLLNQSHNDMSLSHLISCRMGFELHHLLVSLWFLETVDS